MEGIGKGARETPWQTAADGSGTLVNKLAHAIGWARTPERSQDGACAIGLRDGERLSRPISSEPGEWQHGNITHASAGADSKFWADMVQLVHAQDVSDHGHWAWNEASHFTHPVGCSRLPSAVNDLATTISKKNNHELFQFPFHCHYEVLEEEEDECHLWY